MRPHLELAIVKLKRERDRWEDWHHWQCMSDDYHFSNPRGYRVYKDAVAQIDRKIKAILETMK